MLKRMLIPAMLQEIRSGNGDDDGPTTLRFCKGCVAATVTTRRPCDYGVERLLGCTIARKPSQRRRSYATLAIQQRAMTNIKPSQSGYSPGPGRIHGASAEEELRRPASGGKL